MLQYTTMDNLWEIAGISLQLLAGFLFILKQVSGALTARIGRLLTKYLGILSGDPKKRWKKSLVAGVISLPLVIAGIFVYGVVYSGEVVTWSAIGGAALYLLFGYYFYLFSLSGVRRLLGKWKSVERKVGTDYSRTMLVSHASLFVLSILLLSLFAYAYDMFLDSSKNFIWQFFMLLYFFAVMLAAWPVFLVSSAYLAVLALQNSLCFLQGMPSRKFWAFLLVLWTLGCIFLLINACSC